MTVRLMIAVGAALTVATPSAMAGMLQPLSSEVEWSYDEKTGPGQWGGLHEKFRGCAEGRRQSPIDVQKVHKRRVPPVDLRYEEQNRLTVAVEDHVVKAKVPRGNDMVIGGALYHLEHLEFHTPAEHSIKGETYPLEMEMVHRVGRQQWGVVSVFFEYGQPNRELDNILNALGTEKPEGQVVTGERLLDRLLPEELMFIRYSGSQTHPPCLETVRWNLLTTPLQASREQVERFTAITGINARPRQSTDHIRAYTGR